jgi:bacterioferritin
MGQFAKQLVSVNRGALIADLVRAYADEWCAHYNYSFACYVVSGPSSPGLVELLRRKSQRALEHARELAQRIIELGGQPIAKLGDVINSASDKPFKLPENIRDLDEVLKAVLDAERTSMRSYHDLEEKTRGSDLLTHALVLEFLREAVVGEREFERLLGEPAPEMDGR